jgi:hypothetical protein
VPEARPTISTPAPASTNGARVATVRREIRVIAAHFLSVAEFMLLIESNEESNERASPQCTS